MEVEVNDMLNSIHGTLVRFLFFSDDPQSVKIFL